MSEEMFRPAPHVLAGDTADVYFLRTRQVMEAEGLNPIATMEVFPHRDGLLCGMREVEALLREALPKGAEAWALDEGETISQREVMLRINA
ncbi:MAG: nicotinate phosphoribosyltransferase, partial [Chloroflexi bacterium]|nr:nicotinate phosphoribosyltransferase [Chloroflexota bacterium]